MKKHARGLIQVQPSDIRFILEHLEIFNYCPYELQEYYVKDGDEAAEFITIEEPMLVSYLDQKEFILDYDVVHKMHDDELLDYLSELRLKDDTVSSKLDNLTIYRPLEELLIQYPEYYTYPHIIFQVEQVISERNLQNKVKRFGL
jgi:hypothetical protein